MTTSAPRSPRPWLLLAAICAVQFVVVLELHPTNFFGWSGDDAVYFSSAKALADGKGYISPALPGSPPATKYPLFYPWLLSWVWRWYPSFPANLTAAAAVNIVFGLAYVVATFLFLRRLKGVSETGALVLSALCAIHPTVLLYIVNLTTDIPFAAVSLAAMILSSKSFNRNSVAAISVLSGLLSGTTLLLRMVGLPIAAGLLLAHILRAGWRRSAGFAAGVLPFLATLCARLILLHPAEPVAFSGSSACQKSWQLTWTYFTTYQGFWNASAIENHALWAYIKTNATFLVYQVGAYFVDLSQVSLSPLVIVLFILILLIAMRGLIRQIQESDWQPVHLALAFYLAPLLIWDWPSMERFLLPFLPIILAGAWIEGARIINTVRGALKAPSNANAWLAAIVCAIFGAMIFTVSAVCWWRATAGLAYVSAQRSALTAEKLAAYRWLREHSARDARIIAYESVSAFLYCDRQGMPPAVLLPSGKYDQEILKSQLSCMLAPARPIGAQFWIVADDDFRFEWKDATVQEREIEKGLEATHTSLFRSPQAHLRIYKLP